MSKHIKGIDGCYIKNMNDMNIFIQTLRTESLGNKEKRREREFENRKVKDEQIREAMDNLESYITNDMETKMKGAASLGHFQAVLYSFDTSTVQNEYKTIFLIRGPVIRNRNTKQTTNNNNELFFVNKGIQPMLTRLKERLAPMHVYIRYNKLEKRHELIASWKEYDQINPTQ